MKLIPIIVQVYPCHSQTNSLTINVVNVVKEIDFIGLMGSISLCIDKKWTPYYSLVLDTSNTYIKADHSGKSDFSLYMGGTI